MYLTSNKVEADDGRQVQPARPSRRFGYILLLIGVGLLVWLGFRFFSAPAAPPPPPVPTVTVSTPLPRMVNDWDDYVGRFEASKAVEVRPRVSGQLTGLHFRDGDMVRQGQLLFTVDPRPFAAVLDQARAQVTTASTALNLAKAELARANRLVVDQAVSAEEIDSLKARVQSAQADLAAAQAAVRARQLNVEFTQVRAPISGRISDRRVDVGNLVLGDSPAGATVLTTINALNPIYFSFNGSEALYLKHRRDKDAASVAEVRLQDEGDYRWKGRVDFTDNVIENGSGTIRGRAVIANPDNFIVPGMFGNMRMGGGAPHQALLVPDAAVITDQARKVVYVVDREGKAAVKPVESGALVGGLRVIRSGLSPDDRVIIQGTQFAQPGTQVKAVRGVIKPSEGAAARPVSAPRASQATLAN